MKALRQLKEGKEKEWRLTNHAAFRQLVFGLAYPCLAGTEDMYRVLKPSVRSLLSDRGAANPFPSPLPQVGNMPGYQLRLLHTKFNDLLRCLHAVQSHCEEVEDRARARSWRQLEHFGLLDYCVVCSDDQVLLHFDDKCPADVNFGTFNRRDPHLKEMVTPLPVGAVIRSVLGSDSDGSGTDQYYLSDTLDERKIVITVGQVMYAVYQLHVYNCQLPIPLCKFPGCGHIRAEAAAASQGAVELPTTPYLGVITVSESCDLSAVRGSGHHPTDVAIKEYFFSQREIFTKHPPSYLPGHRPPHAAVDSVDGKIVVNEEDSSDDEAVGDAEERAREAREDVSIEDEVAEERRLDQAVIDSRDTDALLQLQWRDLKEEAAMMATLHNALVRPEMAGSVTSHELLMAKGGIHALVEEAAVKKMITKALVTHTGAANSDYSEYETAASSDLIRLVPSAEMLAAAAAEAEAEQALMNPEVHDTGGFGSDFDDDDGASGDLSGRSRSSSSEEEDDDSGSSDGSGSGGQDDSGSEGEGGDEFSLSSAGTEVAAEEKLTVQAVVHLKQTHSIPIEILRALSAAALQSLAVGSVFDPYPIHTDGSEIVNHHLQHHHLHHTGHGTDHHHHHQVNAMPAHMYQLLMQRLRLTRPERVPNLDPSATTAPTAGAAPAMALTRRASAAVEVAAALTAPPPPSHYFRFDRLHHEQVVVLQDGSVVVMQFMYGILAGASLVVIQPKKKKKNPKLYSNNDIFPNIEIYEAVSGSPPAAIRFLHTSKLPTLKPGLTVAVFDALSSVSRAFIIEERSMRRTCEAFGVPGGDFTALSRKIAAHAHKCVQLTRAGLYCTTVMFSLASLTEESADEEQEEAPIENSSRYDIQVLDDEVGANVLIIGDCAEPDLSPVPDIEHIAPVTTIHHSGVDSAEFSTRSAYSHRNVLGRFSALQSLLAT
jgi:hypothetical protein